MKPYLLLGCYLASLTLHAEDFQGADTILKRLAEKAAAKPAAEAKKKANPVEELRLKVKDLQAQAANLPPEEAATRWMALLEAYITIPDELLYSDRAYGDRLQLQTIIASLPPPAAWPAIRSKLDAQKSGKPMRDSSYKLFSAFLAADVPKLTQLIADLRRSIPTLAKMEDWQRQNSIEQLDELEEAILQHSGDKAAKLDHFTRQLDQDEKGDADARDYLSIPDLVALTSEDKARALILRIFKIGYHRPSFEGKRTQALAADLALSHIADLKKPLWALVHRLQDAKLYEALDKKFPDIPLSDRDDSQCLETYFVALIAADRTEDAVKFATKTSLETGGNSALSISADTLDELGQQGLRPQVHHFLRRLLETDPAQPFWPLFIELSARESASADALDFMRGIMAKPGLSPAANARIQGEYFSALLAADQRDEGTSILRDLVKAGPQGLIDDGTASAAETKRRWENIGVHVTDEMLAQFTAQARNSSRDTLSPYLNYCRKLASLGSLLERPELIDEACAAATKALSASKAAEPYSRQRTIHEIANLLYENKRAPAAEALLLSFLEELVTPPSPGTSQQHDKSGYISPTLAELASLYHASGRHADVLTLLDRSPHWRAPDIAALESISPDIGNTPFLLIVARALKEAGRIDEARKVIQRAAQDFPARDAIYALLLELEAGQPLLDRLDQLSRRDRFQERPLIWKARVLLDAGRTAEAETTIRAAIAIDPSDGEQGKGDRMRAYAVLADVLDKKGDPATAKIMRRAVSAIRKSEAADDWWSAGLLSEAVKRYNAALLDFADAYCIQSRLALRYSELGEFAKSEQHYLRAFQLMPESFGRIESHCFGCEGAFNGPRAQSVAERVFTQLAAAPDAKPQVHYLLGYLRESQDRPAEAAEAYRAAVKLDPDYLNAWKNLIDLADEIDIPQPELETAVLHCFRLDPAAHHHSSSDVEQLRDSAKLWAAILTAEAATPTTETGPLYTLAATKEELQRKNPNSPWDRWSYPTHFSQQQDFRLTFLRQPLLKAVSSFMENNLRKSTD